MHEDIKTESNDKLINKKNIIILFLILIYALHIYTELIYNKDLSAQGLTKSNTLISAKKQIKIIEFYAEIGNTEAQFLMGEWYAGRPIPTTKPLNYKPIPFTYGVTKERKIDKGDKEKAIRWYEKAAKGGLTKAGRRLVEDYNKGSSFVSNAQRIASVTGSNNIGWYRLLTTLCFLIFPILGIALMIIKNFKTINELSYNEIGSKLKIFFIILKILLHMFFAFLIASFFFVPLQGIFKIGIIIYLALISINLLNKDRFYKKIHRYLSTNNKRYILLILLITTSLIVGSFYRYDTFFIFIVFATLIYTLLEVIFSIKTIWWSNSVGKVEKCLKTFLILLYILFFIFLAREILIKENNFRASAWLCYDAKLICILPPKTGWSSPNE